MIIYIILVLIITILGFILKPKRNEDKLNNNSKIFLTITFLLLFIVSGFRSKLIGVDTWQFYNAFSRIASVDFKQFDIFRYEYGFTFLCWILSKIINNPQILLISTAFFINFSVLHFIRKNSNNIFASVLIYIFLNFYFSYMNIMRQAIAISIILWGYEFLKDKKYLKYTICCIIASLFHESALLALLLIVIKKIKFNKKTILVTIALIVLSLLYGNQFFNIISNYSPRLLYYVDSKFSVSNYFGAVLDAMVYIVLYIIGIIIISKNNKQHFTNKDSSINFLIGAIGLACIFHTLTIKVIIFNRFSPYFTIFIVIWITNCLSMIKNNKSRLLLYIIIFFFLILYWLIIMIYRPDWYGVVPYEFFV